MSNNRSARLTGDELLDFVETNAPLGEKWVIENAGYFAVRNGRVTLKNSEYHAAVSAARGIVFGPTLTNRPSNRQPTYRIRTSNRNVIPVSGCYSRMLDLQPGDQVDIESIKDPDGNVVELRFRKHTEELEAVGACAILA